MSAHVPNRSSDGVRAQLFPRTDFSQWGWLGAIYKPSEQAAWASQTQSFRLSERKQQRERRFLLTDFPQQGWVGKASGSGTYYEALTGFGWWSDTQSFRSDGRAINYGPRGKRHDYYQTTPQQGWILKPTGSLFEAASSNWPIDTARTATGKRYWPDTNTFTPSFDPSANDWHVDTSLASKKNGSQWYQTQSLDGWWTAAISGTAFDPSTFPWSNYGYGDRPTYDRSLFLDLAKGTRPGGGGGGSFDFPPVPFDPSTAIWSIDSGIPKSRPSPKYWRDALKVTSAFALLDTRPLQSAFDQSMYSARMRNRISRRAVDNDFLGWLQANLAAAVQFDPASFNWTIDSGLSVRKLNQKLNVSDDLFAWIQQNLPVAFDPQYFVHISDDRLRDRYKKTPRLDQFSQAWIFNTVPPFDPSLLFHGNEPFCMGDRDKLNAQLFNFYGDMSWVHDVLGLIDPPPVPDTIILRPIAPIMAARRRNKRRR